VEEYFHVNAFERVLSREDWPLWPQRLDRSVPPILDSLARADAKGTFFVLGWVAEKNPAIVRSIVDAGHEIASHGYWHRRVVTLTPAQFREDLRQSKDVLENVAGAPVLGFRAPSFSIIPGCEWAFDVLLEEGFLYDSSVFPIRRSGYGNPDAPRVPYVIRRAAGTLAEFPLATTSIFGVTMPAAGGGYLRQFPFALIRRAFAEGSARGVPSTFYIHPWEIDPEQPRMPVSLLTRMRHYRGLDKTLAHIDRLLGEFRFVSIASALNHVPGADAAVVTSGPS
jgi:polysaccharide deacetylase family protein (PEP-CTERM system associated)